MTKPIKILLMVIVIVPAVFFGGAFCLLGMNALARHGPHRRTSPIFMLRMLNAMEREYSATYPDRGFAWSLENLGGNLNAGPPTADAAQLIPEDVASGNKAGYTLSFTGCTKSIVNNKARVTGYKIIAVPNVKNRSGDYGFCTDESAQIRYDPNGGTNYTELLK